MAQIRAAAGVQTVNLGLEAGVGPAMARDARVRYLATAQRYRRSASAFTAMPPTISAAATSSDASRRSPRRSAPPAMPTIGVAVMPSDVVSAGRLRFTIDIAQ